MLKWQLVSDDALTTVYRKERAGYKAHLHINKREMTASFTESAFEFHEGAYTPQWREESEWVKYSAKYGTWYQSTYEASIEDIDFALTLLRACSNRQEAEGVLCHAQSYDYCATHFCADCGRWWEDQYREPNE